MNANANKKPTASAPPSDSTGTGDVALVQSPQTAQAQNPDQGRGGLYTLVNGVRQRVEGTQHPADAEKKE